MQEPLPTADDFQELLPGIFRWAAYSPFHRVELASHAVYAGDWLLIFDPIPLAEVNLSRLAAVGRRRAIVLTNANHERAATQWSEGLSTQVWRADADGLLAGTCPWPGWTRLPLPGGAPDETGWLHAGLSLAVLGDAVVNLPQRTLELLPDKYCTDPSRLRHSLKVLPPFERALLAHGQPLLTGAWARIAALL